VTRGRTIAWHARPCACRLAEPTTSATPTVDAGFPAPTGAGRRLDQTTFQMRDSRPELFPEMTRVDDDLGMPGGIKEHIRRRPIADSAKFRRRCLLGAFLLGHILTN